MVSQYTHYYIIHPIRVLLNANINYTVVFPSFFGVFCMLCHAISGVVSFSLKKIVFALRVGAKADNEEQYLHFLIL